MICAYFRLFYVSFVHKTQLMQCAPNLTQIILYCMRPTSGFPKRSGYEVSLYKETILIHTKFILFKMNSHPVNVNALNTVVSMTTPDVSVPSCPIFFAIT